MRNILLVLAVLGGMAASQAFAQGGASDDGEMTDAEAIARAEVNVETMALGVDLVSDVIASNLKLQFEQSGLDVSEEATRQIVSQFRGPLIDRMENGTRKETARIYARTLSPEALAAYRAFVESPGGAEYRSKLPEIMSQLQEYGELSGAAHASAAFKDVVRDVKNDDWVGAPTEAVKDELRELYAPENVGAEETSL